MASFRLIVCPSFAVTIMIMTTFSLSLSLSLKEERLQMESKLLVATQVVYVIMYRGMWVS